VTEAQQQQQKYQQQQFIRVSSFKYKKITKKISWKDKNGTVIKIIINETIFFAI